MGRDSDDRSAFAATAVSQYGRRLKRFFATRVRSRSDASDLAQEVFLRLLRVRDHDSIRSPESYLFTIANHLLHQHALRASALPETVDIDELCGELRAAERDDPAQSADMQLRIEQLDRALTGLSPLERSALLLHRCAGFSIEEIGEQLGVARSTAKKYLARALLHCRDGRLGRGVEGA